MRLMTFTMVGIMALAIVAGTGMVSPSPAQADSDLPAILAGAAVGYLVYKALDNDDRSGYREPYYDNRYQNYNPPRGGYNGYGRGNGNPRRTYDRGYRDGWTDGYRTGYREGSYSGGYYGSHYNPPRW